MCLCDCLRGDRPWAEPPIGAKARTPLSGLAPAPIGELLRAQRYRTEMPTVLAMFTLIANDDLASAGIVTLAFMPKALNVKV